MDFIKDALTDFGAYIWFSVLAVLGGTANYISKVRANRQKAFSVVELIGEWVVSAFTGLMTAYMCVSAGMSFELTCCAAGVAGHAGGRGIYLLEQIMLARAGVNVQSHYRHDGNDTSTHRGDSKR